MKAGLKLGFIGKFWFETHLKYLVTLMLSNLTLKKSKQTEKLKVITFFSVAHFGLLLPKIRLILAPIWPFLKNFWFRFRFLKDNSMMMINSTDFASNLQKNRKMWTISYLLRWINNYRVLLLVYLVGRHIYRDPQRDYPNEIGTPQIHMKKAGVFST